MSESDNVTRLNDTPTLAQMVPCVLREIAMRQQVYPKRVTDKKMKHEEMVREIATMKAVLNFLIESEAAEFIKRTKISILNNPAKPHTVVVTGAFNGFQIRNGEMAVEDVRDIMKEHGLSKPTIDTFFISPSGEVDERPF